ncbi:MAG: polysaccharide biosynthesis protein [Clostridia bacterium]|nr:polysaccharide biosynthesis protein [Clostridia bacterium]
MKNGLYKGALLLTVCALVGKLVGAFYRIPFAMIVGGEGVGLYQLVYPLYALMLTISTSGLPSSISKLLSQSYAAGEHGLAKRYFRYSLAIIITLSSIAFVLVLSLSGVLAEWQGNPDASLCYAVISPALVFAGVVAGIRGYFQAQENMLPTAISGLVEQIVKVAVGLLLAFMLKDYGIVYATAGAMLGVTASELVASIYMIISLKVFQKKRPTILLQESEHYSRKQIVSNILKISVPIAFGGLIMPITLIVDSTLIVKILSSTMDVSRATMLFGLQSGVVGSLVNLPVVASIAVQTVVLPRLTREKTQKNAKDAQKTIKNALFFTLIITIPCAFCYYFFSNNIINLLYSKSFNAEQIEIASRLLRFGSLNIIMLSLAQVTAGILQGLGKVKIPVFSMLIASIVKVISVYLLVNNANIGIYGAEISDVICYLLVSVINLFVIHKSVKFNAAKELIEVAIVSVIVALASYFSKSLLSNVLSSSLVLLVGGSATVLIYFVTLTAVIKLNRHKNADAIEVNFK